MINLTTLVELGGKILTLSNIEAQSTPFVSCYLNLEQGSDKARVAIDQRVDLPRRVLNGSDLDDFEESIAVIKRYLDRELLPGVKGLAFFARSSFEREIYMPLQFAVPLPNQLKIYPTPDIYHLIELKDTYERYLMMIATAKWVRILEVNLGAATLKAWSENPQLGERVSTEWSNTHYQIYRCDREGQFLQEKIAVLEKLMYASDHSHLILAGDPQITERIRQALPKHLAAKLMDIIPANHHDEQTDIVAASLSVFVEQEERDSRSIADRLIQAIRTQGLAVVGVKKSLDSLQRGQVDTLVLLQEASFDPGWLCSICYAMDTTTPENRICPHCGADAVRPIDIQEELVRLAGKWNCPVEVVETSDDLTALGASVACCAIALIYRPRNLAALRRFNSAKHKEIPHVRHL